MASPPHAIDRAPTPARLRAPLIGRAAELSLLEDALSDMLEKRGTHTLLIMGAPGIGKSRLCREFLADVRVRHENVRVLTGHCRPNGDPFGVIRSILRARLSLGENLEPVETEAVLRKTVSEIIGDRRVGEFVHFLGAFLDLQLTGSALSQAISDDPDQQQKVGRSVLRRFLEADAEKQPLVIVLEDFHLAHDDAAALVHYLVNTIASRPILFVVVSRPELLNQHPEWLELRSDAIRFDLGPLDHDDTADMTERLLSPIGEVPSELIDEATEMAAGNPYLVEQIVRTYLEEQVVIATASGKWQVDLSRLPRVSLPLSVDDAIATRIAGLSPEEKSLLEMAAAVGGVFWRGALVALERAAAAPPRLWSSPADDRIRIDAMLEALTERDYVMRLPDSSVPSDVEYAFKHNLERESLHRYTSRQLLVRYHQVIAQWLELHLLESTEEQHELLAQHYERGGATSRAAQHYLLAAERARARYAAARAADYYGRGLQLLGEGEGLLRINSLERWGEALQASGASPAALRAFEDMRTSAYHLDLIAHAAAAHAQIGRVYRELGKLIEAMEHLDTAHALYEGVADKLGSARSLEAMAAIHALRGNFAAAEHMLGEVLQVYETARDERALARCKNRLGVVYQSCQRYPEALDAFTQALSLLRKLDDNRGVAESLTYLGVTQDHMGEAAHALALWNEALQVTQLSGDRVQQTVVLTCLGSAAYRANQGADALKLLSQAEAIATTLGDRLQEADTRRSLAKARAFIGDFAGAIKDIEQAIALFESAESTPQLGVALRTFGEIAAQAPSETPTSDGQTGSATPDALFERALQIFEGLGNDLELARSALSYGDYLAQVPAPDGEGELPKRDRIAKVESLRKRSRELLERHKGLTIRASQIPPPPRRA